MGIGDIENMMYGDVDNDEDLEAELLALQGEDNPVRRKPKQQQKCDYYFRNEFTITFKF